MSNGQKKTDPEQLKPLPGMPTRHLLPPRPSRTGDDPVAVRMAELEAKRIEDEVKLAELEAKRLEDQIKLAELELRLKFSERPAEFKEQAPHSRGAGFVLQIKDWDKATKFIISITALVSALALALGLKNNAEKAPKPEVVKVATEAAELKRVVTGETDLAGASSAGEDVVSKVNSLQKQVGPMVSASCPRAQWWKAVLAHAKPPIMVKLPEGCHDSPSIAMEIEEVQALPGRGPKIVNVRTPMPGP